MSEDKRWFQDHDVDSLAWRPRPTVLPWPVLAIIIGIALGAALWPAFSHAEEIPVHVFEDDSVALRLFAAPCENDAAKLAVVGTPVQALADKLQKATSNWRVMSQIGFIQVDYAGCWVAFIWRGKQGYAVSFEDGEIHFFPAEGFKRTKGQTGT